MLPVVIALGLGVSLTVGALTVRATARTVRQAWKLTPAQVFALNNVSVTTNTHFLPGGFQRQMDTHEARQILGLPPTGSLSNAEISKRHRAMMAKNHPDLGGSGHLASKVNEAKQVLKDTK